MRLTIATVAIDAVTIVVVVVQGVVVAAGIAERGVAVGDEDHVGRIAVVEVDPRGILEGVLPVGAAVCVKPVDSAGERVVAVRRPLGDRAGRGEAHERHLDQVGELAGVVRIERPGEAVDGILGSRHTRLGAGSSGSRVHRARMVQDYDDVDGIRLPLGLADHVEGQRICAVLVVRQALRMRRLAPCCTERKASDAQGEHGSKHRHDKGAHSVLWS